MDHSQFVSVTYIRTTVEKLWQALTQPDYTRQYWCDTWQDCDWKPGSSWRIIAPDGRMVDQGAVVEADPPRRLSVTWRHELNAEMLEEGYSRLTYELEQVGTSAKLTVTHEIDLPKSKLIHAVSTGWPMILSSLKSLLETGESLEESRHWPKGI